MSMRMKYEAKLEAQLGAWHAQLEALKTHVGEILKAEWEAAHTAWSAALVKVEELKASAGGRWGSLKAEAEAVCRAVEVALGPIAHLAPAAVPVPKPDPDAATRITDKNIPVVAAENDPPPAS